MNVVLSAEDAAGIQALRAFGNRPHRIVAVMASPGRSTTSGATVWDAAVRMGLPVWPAERLTDSRLATTLHEEGADILLNVHSLYLVHAEVLAALPLGGFNLHPALLPRYAGLNSVSWAIYHGETEHGVTIHRMDPLVDAGPIVYQARIPIDPNETGLSLSAKCVRAGVGLMLRLADVAASDPASIPMIPQELSKRSYFGRDVPQSGRIDWGRSAAAVSNFVRACDYRPFPSPWGTPVTLSDGRDVGVVSAVTTGEAANEAPGTVRQASGQAVEVACADQWLRVNRVRSEEGITPAARVLRPGQRLGTDANERPAPVFMETTR
jgi:UDP-4-amino-4-deoxy-L-arabinose formyltransferase/UDP-glucuronic acid dehydrogenase (UDP-4-keto-hexauronic acid decarboxylating)